MEWETNQEAMQPKERGQVWRSAEMRTRGTYGIR
jgi:hypothetical protein